MREMMTITWTQHHLCSGEQTCVFASWKQTSRVKESIKYLIRTDWVTMNNRSFYCTFILPHPHSQLFINNRLGVHSWLWLLSDGVNISKNNPSRPPENYFIYFITLDVTKFDIIFILLFYLIRRHGKHLARNGCLLLRLSQCMVLSLLQPMIKYIETLARISLVQETKEYWISASRNVQRGKKRSFLLIILQRDHYFPRLSLGMTARISLYKIIRMSKNRKMWRVLKPSTRAALLLSKINMWEQIILE